MHRMEIIAIPGSAGVVSVRKGFSFAERLPILEAPFPKGGFDRFADSLFVLLNA